MPTTKELVTAITDYVNTFSDKSKEFCNVMSNEHSTLQQSFTKLCFQWLEHVASDDYRVDGRNIDSQKISRELLGLYREKLVREGYTETTLELISKPSKCFRMV